MIGVTLKRDLGLIRSILLEVESFDEDGSYNLEIPGKSSAEIIYNASLLVDEGYIKGKITTYLNGTSSLYLESLTWSGHDLLDSMRNDDVWNKLKRTIQDTVGNVSLETVKELGVALTKQYLKDNLGL